MNHFRASVCALTVNAKDAKNGRDIDSAPVCALIVDERSMKHSRNTNSAPVSALTVNAKNAKNATNVKNRVSGPWRKVRNRNSR